MDPKQKDNRNLTVDQQAQLEQWQMSHDQLEKLEDMALILQKLLGEVEDTRKSGDKNTTNFASLMMDIRESLTELKNKKSPEVPDFVKPLNSAVEKLDKAFQAAMSKIDARPKVNVSAPNVQIDAPQVDLKGVEKVLKTDIPKAFKMAINSIPQTTLPDNSEDFKQIINTLKEVRDRPIPIPSMPSNMGIRANGAIVSAANPLPVNAEITVPPITITNDGTFAKETGGNLDTIAGKDFATQTTLALIKAKTDNLDVALSTRTKPTDAQHVIVDSGVTTGLTDTQLRATPVPVSEVTGLVPKIYDSLTYTATSSTIDTYAYYQGGTGGSLVATLTVTFTAADHLALTSVVRT